jgi:membrane protein
LPSPHPHLADYIDAELRNTGEANPTYQVVAGTVGLLVSLNVINQLILFAAALTATSTTGAVTDLAVRAGSPTLSGGQDTSSATTVVPDAGPTAEPTSDRRHPVGGPGADEDR